MHCPRCGATAAPTQPHCTLCSAPLPPPAASNAPRTEASPAQVVPPSPPFALGGTSQPQAALTQFGLGAPALVPQGPLGFGSAPPQQPPTSPPPAVRPLPQVAAPTVAPAPRAPRVDPSTVELQQVFAASVAAARRVVAGTSSAANDRPLTGFLVSFQDDPNGRYWPLRSGKNRVGRADTGQAVDVALPHGTTSTHHAVLDCLDDRVTLADLGSTNGTYHNEHSVGFQGKRELRDGDRLRFGGFTAVLILLGPRL
jgi:hypothetical protein